jgi:HEAT repeat protein
MDKSQAKYFEQSQVRKRALNGAAAAALTGRHRPIDILNVASLLKSRDPLTRCGAIKNLATIAGRQAIHAITRVLYDPHPEVRVAACKALGKMRAHPAKTQLLDTLNDTDPVVALAAAEALAIMGENLGLLHIARLVRTKSTHKWRALRLLNGLTGSEFPLNDKGLTKAKCWIKQNRRRFTND